MRLWNDLMRLADTKEAFYYTDQERDGHWYRIFLYRLTSYTDFLEPNALECRGVTFNITEEGKSAKPINLVSLPFEKFFNYKENQFTTDINLSKIVQVSLKIDGSLITTYTMPETEYLRCKSKGSLHSEHAMAAEKFLKHYENSDLYHEIWVLEQLEHTIIMEWCAPFDPFRIVINYDKPQLTALGVRNRVSGYYVRKDELQNKYPNLCKIWTPLYNPLNDYQSYTDFVEDIPDMQNIEGYVLQLESGQRVKVKTNWYLTQHRAKDSINSERRLFEAVLSESTDDLRTLFYDNPSVIQRIENMEKYVGGVYNHIVDLVERFYERNKHLDRKEYAILGQQELERREFTLVMQEYLNKPIDYKQWMIKHYKDFDISDNEEYNNE
jgi:T4 RnlA family RNA ligase